MRAIDGFDIELSDAYKGYSPRVAGPFWRSIDRVSERLHVELAHPDRIGAGAALLVMNHAFGWDAMLPMAAIQRATGRQVWALGEHLWWKVPFLRTLAARVGAVDGTAANVDRLLQNGELVLVLPGGLREAMKPRELRYRLLWGRRYGFVRAALRNQARLVPLAGIGADEVFDLVGDAYGRGRRWLKRDFPIPRPEWGLPIPHFPRLRYIVGDPIEATLMPDETEEHAARRLRREARGALEELIDDALAERAGVRP
ncbi:MAG: lysophospholipid acyltransferase family protein [Polyangiaceae bacterium]